MHVHVRRLQVLVLVNTDRATVLVSGSRAVSSACKKQCSCNYSCCLRVRVAGACVWPVHAAVRPGMCRCTAQGRGTMCCWTDWFCVHVRAGAARN
jgi:hypothetical protein